MESDISTIPPTIRYFGTLYRVGHHVKGKRFNDTAQVTIRVAEDRFCDLHDWYWFGKRKPQVIMRASDPLYYVERQVWDWLIEWELVELRQVSREDWEFFATDKLIGGGVDIVLEDC